ncbi:MAG: 4-hydroxybenzoate 3-monooxygenase [Cyanobacteria bacterium J06623_7]
MMSTQTINTKVCIIGAGPAGLIIANILSKYGIPCIVIEKYSQTEIYARSRAGLIDYKTIAILQEHGLGDRLMRQGRAHGKCEFRTPEHSFVLDYAGMSDNQTHYTYPQQDLLADLIYRFQESGGTILFDTQGITIENEQYGAQVYCRHREEDLVIKSEFIAGCDGFHGVSRSFMPESVTQPQITPYNYAWLAITAEAPPSTEHIIYGIHPRGFAGHMLRTATISRYYLQIPLEDTAAEWSSDRIWAELQLRLAKDNWTLTEGRIIEKRVLTMRSFATQTMQYKSLFLAGDAAHIMTPAGGKGMNLAIQDADVLGKSCACYYRYQDNRPLKNYSASRLPEIHQALEFSESLLHTINAQFGESTAENSLLKLLQKFQLSQLMNSQSYARDFARKYVGHVGGKVIALPSLPISTYSVPQKKFIKSKPLTVVS